MRSLEKCYEILGVSSATPQDQIKQAYHDLVKVWHPDRFANDASLQARAQEKLKEINEAYDQIMSPHLYTARSRPAPYSQPKPPAHSPPPSRPKDKYWMMPVVSFITLVIAVAILSMIFYIYGRPYEPVHEKETLQQPT